MIQNTVLHYSAKIANKYLKIRLKLPYKEKSIDP